MLSDRKEPNSMISGVATSYNPVVLAAKDYYPFGMEMEGRSNAVENYRYGFNGKEADRDEWGSLTHYDYGFRIYNPSIGKFLSVDPLTASYPMLTPYQFASNTPIAAIDLDGLESWVAILRDFGNRGLPELKLYWDENAEFVGKRSFHLIHEDYDENGHLLGGSSGTATFENFPYFFPDQSRPNERRDGKGWLNSTLEGTINYGGIASKLKLFGSSFGYEIGAERNLLKFEARIDSKNGLTINILPYDKNEKFDVRVGAAVVFGGKIARSFDPKNGYTGDRKVELSAGVFNAVLNNAGDHSIEIENEYQYQFLFGYKSSLKMGIYPNNIDGEGNYYFLQLSDENNNKVQRDNTKIID